MTPAGKIERLEVPRDREGEFVTEFVTEVLERYKRMTGDVEEAVLEMYLSGISVRKIAGVTEALSRVKVGKDAVSRGGDRGRTHLSSLPRLSPREATHDEHAGAVVQEGEAENEGGWGLPQRDERGYFSDGDSFEEQ